MVSETTRRVANETNNHKNLNPSGTDDNADDDEVDDDIITKAHWK